MGLSWRIVFGSGILLLLLLLCSSCAVDVHQAEVAVNSGSGSAVTTVDVHQANHLIIHSGYRYLDVRTTEEYNKGHANVENVINIPYMFITPEGRKKNPQFLEHVISVCNKDDHLLVGCQSGIRSLHASVELLNVDFKDVKNIGGGYAAWVENGFLVKAPKVEL